MKLKVLLTFFSFTLYQFSFAQNLCTDPAYERGSFSLSSNTICFGVTLNTIDASNASSVSYVFDYRGEDLFQAKAKAKNINSAVYSSIAGGGRIVISNKPQEITILQLATKNGNTITACQKVIVKPNNTPELSYGICKETGTNNYKFNLTIPVSPFNDYDVYTLNYGPGIPSFNINASQLPYYESKVFNLSTGARPVSFTGYYNTKPQTCPAVINTSLIRPFSLFTFVSPPDYKYNAQIETVKLNSKTNVTISLNGELPNAAGTNKYTINGYLKGNHLAIPYLYTQNNAVPDNYQFTLADSTKSYCFFAQRTNACGTIEKSAEICTVPLLSVEAPANTDFNKLTWVQYPANTQYGATAPPNMQYTSSQTVNWIQTQPTPQAAVQVPWPALLFNYNHQSPRMDCRYQYCYYIEQNPNGVFQGLTYRSKSISNIICVDRSKVKPPAIDKLWVGAVDPKDKNQVGFIDNSIWKVKPFKEWRLFENQNGEYKEVATKGPALPQQIIDDRPIFKSNEYKIGYLDKCNSLSELSPSIKSVFLSYDPVSTLKWNRDIPVSKGAIKTYEAVPLDETTLGPITPTVDNIANTINRQFVNFDNDKQIDYAPFYLNIYPDSTNLATVLRSNIIKIPITPNFYFPTVFTPNADGINSTFNLYGRTRRVTSINFKFYDNLGNFVYEYDNPAYVYNPITVGPPVILWDGTTKNGKEVPPGNYAYKWIIKLNTGEVFKKIGSVQLLR